MEISTAKGMIDLSLLTVKDIVVTEDNARIIATEWYLGEELVRRDVNVNILRGLEVFNTQAAI